MLSLNLICRLHTGNIVIVRIHYFCQALCQDPLLLGTISILHLDFSPLVTNKLESNYLLPELLPLHCHAIMYVMFKDLGSEIRSPYLFFRSFIHKVLYDVGNWRSICLLQFNATGSLQKTFLLTIPMSNLFHQRTQIFYLNSTAFHHSTSQVLATI